MSRGRRRRSPAGERLEVRGGVTAKGSPLEQAGAKGFIKKNA